MDEDKRYLLVPYGILILLLIRMYHQQEFSGFPLFIAVMLGVLCVFTTWLVFRPQGKEAEQPAEQPRSAEPVKPVRAEPSPAPKPVEASQPEPAKPASVKDVPAVPKPAPHRSLNLLYYTLDDGKLMPAKLTGSQEAGLRQKALERAAKLDVSCIDTTGVTGMSSAFARCYCLERLDLSTFDFSQVTDMGGMFDECSRLKEVIFSDTVRSVRCIPRYTSTRSDAELNALWKHAYLTDGPQVADIAQERAMSKQLISFGEATPEELCAYLGLTTGTKITVVPHRQPSPLPASDDDPGFLIDGDTLVFYYGRAEEVRVPDGIRVIGDSAFSSRPKDWMEPRIPAPYRAQYSDPALDDIAPLVRGQIPGNPYIRRVILPKGLTHIRQRAFYRCATLTSVKLPDTLTFIGNNAFCFCPKLTDIALPKNASLTLSPFYGCSKEVHRMLIEWEKARKPAPPPPPQLHLPTPPEGGLTLQNANFDIKDGVLLHYKGRDSHVIVPEGVHTIGKQAFVTKTTRTRTTSVPPMYWDQYGADSFTGQAEVTTTTCDGMPFIQRVTLPESIHTIGEEAFLKCGGLQEINFPQSLQVIMYRAFFQCRGLKAIDIPQHVQLEMSAFDGCGDEVILAASKQRERSGKPLTIRGHLVHVTTLDRK